MEHLQSTPHCNPLVGAMGMMDVKCFWFSFFWSLRFLCELGIFAFNNHMEEPFHSSDWESFSARRSTIKALPRPLEDYQRALKEMMDAASKASMFFDEIYSFCYKSDLAGSGLDSVNIPTSSLPPDVLHSGQAYQRMAPQSLQVIQRLADKVSACAFPPDSPNTAKSSGDVTFHKSSDFGKFYLQLYPNDQGYTTSVYITYVNLSLCQI